MIPRVRVYAEPSDEPVSSTEAKAHLYVTGTDDDTKISALIKVARLAAEKETGRALVTQTLDQYFDLFPAGPLVLERPRLQSVTSVTYTDEDGVSAVVPASTYRVDDKSEPGRVVLNVDKDWPNDDLVSVNGVVVRYVAGYGAASAVPEDIKAAMLLIIGHLFEAREDSAETARIQIPSGARSLLAPYRVWGCV